MENKTETNQESNKPLVDLESLVELGFALLEKSPVVVPSVISNPNPKKNIKRARNGIDRRQGRYSCASSSLKSDPIRFLLSTRPMQNCYAN